MAMCDKDTEILLLVDCIMDKEEQVVLVAVKMDELISRVKG